MPNYTYPGTDTVKNLVGARTHDELERREAAFVVQRMRDILLGHAAQGQFDAVHLRAIHKHLFQDVYEWAGRTRDEQVALSDGTVASELTMHKPGEKDVLLAPMIPAALEQIERDIRAANGLRGLSREEFARRGAEIMAAIDTAHPFREGNGRTQCVFMHQLAAAAGHALDFSVVSAKRLADARFAAREQGDNTPLRSLFDEISHLARVAALRYAIEALDLHGFEWHGYFLGTLEPGQPVELTMAGVARRQFMARTAGSILIGQEADLPIPYPARGEVFTITPSPWTEAPEPDA